MIWRFLPNFTWPLSVKRIFAPFRKNYNTQFLDLMFFQLLKRTNSTNSFLKYLNILKE